MDCLHTTHKHTTSISSLAASSFYFSSLSLSLSHTRFVTCCRFCFAISVLLQFAISVKVVCFFIGVATFFFVTFLIWSNRNYLLPFFRSLWSDGVEDDEDEDARPIQSLTQSENFINLLPSITHVFWTKPQQLDSSDLAVPLTLFLVENYFHYEFKSTGFKFIVARWFNFLTLASIKAIQS